MTGYNHFTPLNKHFANKWITFTTHYRQQHSPHPAQSSFNLFREGTLVISISNIFPHTLPEGQNYPFTVENDWGLSSQESSTYWENFLQFGDAGTASEAGVCDGHGGAESRSSSQRDLTHWTVVVHPASSPCCFLTYFLCLKSVSFCQNIKSFPIYFKWGFFCSLLLSLSSFRSPLFPSCKCLCLSWDKTTSFWKSQHFDSN